MKRSNRKKAHAANRRRKKKQRFARISPVKIRYETTGKNETGDAGLAPVIGFLNDTVKLDDLIDEHLPHERGANAQYQLGNIIFMTVVGLIAGKFSIRQILKMWCNRALRRIAGFLRIPNESTFGRIIKDIHGGHVKGLAEIIHAARNRIWRRASATGKSSIASKDRKWIDLDSTVKTTYGHQEGTMKGFNSHKRGAHSYHPLLAFLSRH